MVVYETYALENHLYFRRKTMTTLLQKFESFLYEDSAATAVEYALLLGLIAVFCISAILSTGDVQKSLWFDTAASIESHIVPN